MNRDPLAYDEPMGEPAPRVQFVSEAHAGPSRLRGACALLLAIAFIGFSVDFLARVLVSAVWR